MEWLTSNAWWIRLLVEIGIFAGVTYLVYINRYYYNQSLRAKNDQIELKNEQIALLEMTQAENFVAKLEAQKNIFNEMEEGYVKRISEIEASQEEKDQLIAELKTMLNKLEKTAETTTLATSGHLALGGTLASVIFSGQSAFLERKDKK
jgi:hypothetical protein